MNEALFTLINERCSACDDELFCDGMCKPLQEEVRLLEEAWRDDHGNKRSA